MALITLNPSIVGDIFVTGQQGTGQAIMDLVSLVGPVLGPTIEATFLNQWAGDGCSGYLPSVPASLKQTSQFSFRRHTRL